MRQWDRSRRSIWSIPAARPGVQRMQCDCGRLRHCQHSFVNEVFRPMKKQSAIDGLLGESSVDNLAHKAQLFTD